jgi:hypothetical protein
MKIAALLVLPLIGWLTMLPFIPQITPICRNYTHNVNNRLLIFVMDRNINYFLNDFYAKIKTTGTNDH